MHIYDYSTTLAFEFTHLIWIFLCFIVAYGGMFYYQFIYLQLNINNILSLNKKKKTNNNFIVAVPNITKNYGILYTSE